MLRDGGSKTVKLRLGVAAPQRRKFKFPTKPGLCLGFVPLLRDTYPEPPLPCKGEGVIETSFSRNLFRI